MNTKEVMADFQFIGNRVSKLALKTELIEESGQAEANFNIDYNVIGLHEENNTFLGILELIINVTAKVKKKNLFKIDLVMEGGFTGNSEKISKDKFIEMLEMNGLITLLHISRAYLLSISTQSGIEPPVQLPMLNVLKLKQAKHQSSK